MNKMIILKTTMRLFFDYLDEDDEIVEKERKEKRKKELEDLEKEKNVLVLYKPNGKKVYYRLTEDIFSILLHQKS